MSEAVIFANDRPTSLSDDLYSWAICAEDLIRNLHSENEALQQKVYSLESSEKAMQAQLSTKTLLVDSLRKDAELYRELTSLMEGAKGGACLVVNEHLSDHDNPDPEGVVSLQWYPDNSVGCFEVKANSIGDAIDQARGA